MNWDSINTFLVKSEWFYANRGEFLPCTRHHSIPHKRHFRQQLLHALWISPSVPQIISNSQLRTQHVLIPHCSYHSLKSRIIAQFTNMVNHRLEESGSNCEHHVSPRKYWALQVPTLNYNNIICLSRHENEAEVNYRTSILIQLQCTYNWY